MNIIPKIEARAPAKIIISGEHSVLYGGQAIAAALDLRAKTTIRANAISKKRISIRLEDMKSHMSGTLSTLFRVKDRLFNSYKKFLTGKKTIRELIAHPTELFQFGLGTLLEVCYLELKESLDIRLSSPIPIGCGMGSSAATIVSFIRALTHYFKIAPHSDFLEKIVFEIERLQHGRSSGLDTFVSLHGGAVLYEVGKTPALVKPASIQFLQTIPFWIVNTGKPESTTGECVDYIKKREHGRKESSIWQDFQEVTQHIVRAVEKRDILELMKLFSWNHKLLQTLGVVPEKVHSFVQKAEKLGIHMKTTGAGSIRGQNGGMLLGIGDIPPKTLFDEYGYELAQPIRIGFSGVEVVCG